ncbi:MAG: ferredoxin-type protein NapG [Bacteroidota bacterium]
MSKNEKISRRKAFENLTQGLAAVSIGGLAWGSALKVSGKSNLVLRPPGALPEKEFSKACLKCGQCVEACPYDTLKLSTATDGISNGTPYFEARDIPCYMCTDFPCIAECPSKALTEEAISVDDAPSINNSKMGLAVIHKESCIAYWGIQCDACYRACPLMGEAITLELEKNEQTRKHANLKPIVNSDVCTGCGLCEHVCVVEKAAIKVIPRNIATGEVGDHYIKGWEADDEKRLQKPVEKLKEKDDVNSALDYLNSDDDLIEN